MIDLNRISVNQVVLISQIINESSLMQQEFIEAKYLRTMQNYQATIDFLRELKLVRISKDKIVIKSAYKQLLHDIKYSSQPKEMAIRFLVKNIFKSSSQFREYAHEFFSKFSLRDDCYEFKPTLKQKLEYSGIRNFLMDLGLLDYDVTNTKYVIRDNFVVAYPELEKGFHISEQHFRKIQKLKEKIGRAAELKIVEYEKERLSDFPEIIDNIEHVSVKDVSAGYDIKSFDYNEEGKLIPRLIEVKAVPSWAYRFYWTKNEIETSKSNGANYYLYLLPMRTRTEFDIENIKVISDPFANVYNNRSIWDSTIETMSFVLKNNT